MAFQMIHLLSTLTILLANAVDGARYTRYTRYTRYSYGSSSSYTDAELPLEAKLGIGLGTLAFFLVFLGAIIYIWCKNNQNQVEPFKQEEEDEDSDVSSQENARQN